MSCWYFPIDPWLSLSRPLSYCLRSFFPLFVDVTSAARRVRRLSRDRRCENNHRHHIDKFLHAEVTLLVT